MKIIETVNVTYKSGKTVSIDGPEGLFDGIMEARQGSSDFRDDGIFIDLEEIVGVVRLQQ